MINRLRTGKSKWFVLMLLGAFCMSPVFAASDLEKEKRWAEQVEEDLLEGEPVYLNDGKNDFFNIYTEAEEPKDTAVIVLHGIGIHPNWAQVVMPLRTGLVAKGWNTLSMQLPVLPNEATGKDYDPLMVEVPPRIHAGIKFLHEKGAKNIIIVAHSLGARMASYHLGLDDKDIAAYVAIGMGPSNIELLPKVKLPMLDLYGSEDLEGVVSKAADRAKASESNKGYSQQKVDGANHFFDSKDEELVEIVAGWIEALDTAK